MAIKKVIKDHFSFSKKEGTAAIILLVIIGIFIALPYLINPKKKQPVVDIKLQEEIIKQQSGQVGYDSSRYPHQTYSSQYTPASSQENNLFQPFGFDPNTVDEAGWHKLGLRDKTIHTIINYRSKGGQFRQPDDLKKIWGIHPEEAERLLPYIHIANAQVAYKKMGYTPYKPVVIKAVIVDINTATLEELRIIPGTGNGLVFRILKYRERLGGFINIDQVKETYGMNDSSYALMLPYFKLDNPTLTKININTATDYELGGNPYIERSVAKAIVLYRQQHGNYQTIEGIKKIVFIKDALYQKIAPYLTVQ
jgi:competence ComEA-like helix-hairpin-helix protein